MKPTQVKFMESKPLFTKSAQSLKEEKILEFWEKNNIFEKTLTARRNKKPFVFFEGPPSANGKPGIHHAITRAFKDIICRYKTMRGFFVPRKGGWDTHGLPIEIQTEKELGFNNKQDIEQYGIDKFNKKAREIVWQYKDEWERFTKRIGFWLDMKNPYITYNNKYIESVWWILQQIWKKKLLYKDYKVVPYCPRCGTALSSHEVAQGYEEVTDMSVYVKFRIQEGNSLTNRYLLAWTTTPWTLPGNVALAVGPDIEYVEIKSGENNYILAKNCLEVIQEEYTIIKEHKGKDLIGLRYRPLFDSLVNQKIENIENAFQVYPADFVTIEDGTGIVHTAVMYGEDDFALGEKVKLPKYHTVDENGKFKEEVKEFASEYVKSSEKKIIDFLEKNNFLYTKAPITHSYPFCWRCKTPLLYYAKSTWFISVTKVKKDLIKNNGKIHWTPTHLKEGRFGEWLHEIKDWALSRERYWGTPLPIWQCDDCGAQVIIGSLKELNEKRYSKNNKDNLPRNEIGEIDVHRPYIDNVVLKCEKCGSSAHRVKEVIDVWFDSGAMPIAQWHYPFENQSVFKKNYPADYIAEAIDQTRGWFYTLLAIATLLGKGNPYKHVISVSHILDEKGKKMSKSRGNVVDPWYIINRYSNDALRWYLFTINSPGEPKKFKEKDVAERLNKFIATIENSAKFYQLYKGVAKKPFMVKDKKKLPILDQWILSRLNSLILEVINSLDDYKVFKPARAIDRFVDDVSNWYIRRSRRRLQRPQNKKERETASQVLGFVLLELSKLIAPFVPFVAEDIYQTVKPNKGPLSVHLADYPQVHKKLLNKKLEEDMEYTRRIVALGLNTRVKAGIKVRQPLQELKIKYFERGIKDKKTRESMAQLLRDELNVQHIGSFKNTDTLAKMWEKDKDNNLEVALHTEITPELQAQGIARELIRQIQDMRKEAKYHVQDKILIRWSSEDPEIEKVLKDFSDLIQEEVIGKDIKEILNDPDRKLDVQKEVKIHEREMWIGIVKV